MTGIEHIAEAFAAARKEDRAALMPYFTLGFPTPPLSAEIIAAIAGAGADLIELGVPFSDPLADGPTIQHSTQVALEQGITAAGCLEITSRLRQRGLQQPLLLMGYLNPILSYGIARYAHEAALAGADGLIIPDLPPEEAGEMEAACQEHGLALVYLLPPTATAERLEMIAGRTHGFLYLVSLTGVTGARQNLPPNLAEFIQRARAVARTPLAVGFGISNPAQAAAVGKLADGVIVGSALIQAVVQSADPIQTAADFVGSLAHQLKKGRSGIYL